MANKNRSRKNEENFHIYTVDGINFAKTCKITDVPAEAGDELYVDTIPIELTDEFLEVPRRGAKVYYLGRLTLLKKKGEELGLSKTSRNDIKAMMSLDPKWFREVDENYLIIRWLISGYRSLLKSHVALTNRMKALNGSERDILKNAVRALEEQMKVMAKVIVDEAEKRYPYFNKVVEDLGITSLLSKESLAEIIPYVERTRSFSRLKNFFGLFKGRKGVNKFYSKTARYALSRLTAAVLKNTPSKGRRKNT